jgi:hypothetical protein
MIRDFWRTLSKRVVTQVTDSAGGFTETTSDTSFDGWIAELTGAEMLRNQQLGNNATAALFTDTDLNITDRIVDGSVEYEIVWKFTNFHTYYPLKRVK